MSAELLDRPAIHCSTTYEYKIPSGGIKDYPVDYWVHPNTLDRDSQIVVLPNFGEAPSVLQHTVEELHQFPLIVVNLHFPEPSPAGIETTLQAAPLAVAHSFNKIIGRDKDTPLAIAGQSTGGGAALEAVHRERDKWKDLVLVTPLGLNNEFLGDSVTARCKELLARINKNKKWLRKSNDPHPDEMIDELPGDAPKVDRAAFKLRLEWAVQQDGIGILKELIDLDRQDLRRYIGITAAQGDIVFPPDQIHTGVKKLKRYLHLDYQVVEGSHLSWIAPRGRQQLKQGIERLPSLASH